MCLAFSQPVLDEEAGEQAESAEAARGRAEAGPIRSEAGPASAPRRPGAPRDHADKPSRWKTYNTVGPSPPIQPEETSPPRFSRQEATQMRCLLPCALSRGRFCADAGSLLCAIALMQFRFCARLP